MFTQLIYLLVVFLLVGLSAQLDPAMWTDAPLRSFLEGMGLYAGILCLIYLQKKIIPRRFAKMFQHAASIQLVVFLLVFVLALGSHRLLTWSGAAGQWQSPVAFFLPVLYLAGWRLATSKEQVHLLLPFVLPFIAMTLILDILAWLLPATTSSIVFFCVFSVIVIAAAAIFLPPTVVRLWQCRSMEPSPLKTRLELLCAKAHFRHGGLLDWTLLNNSPTAAIVGLIPPFRYILFTKRLQQQLSPESLEAILAHEIGHNYRKHLLLYPLILFGMVICIGLSAAFFEAPLLAWLNDLQALSPSLPWSFIRSLAIFASNALIVVLYFRFVFGLFSRLFERQADLHGIELGLDPAYMIKALDDIAIATGYTHNVPNWHHFSIRDRMNFLEAVSKDPQVAVRHHRKVHIFVAVYVLTALLGTFLLLWIGII